MQGHKSTDVHEELYWRWLERERRSLHAIRKGKWRLMKCEKNPVWHLYDLEADPGETTDLAKKYPEVVKELSQRYQAWDKTLPGVSGVYRKPGGRCPRGLGWATPDNP